MTGVDHMAQQLAVGGAGGVAAVEHQRFHVPSGDGLFPVRHLLEADKNLLQLFIGDFIAHGGQLIPQGVLAGVLAQHHGVFGNAHIGGAHDLIGQGVGQHTVLVNAGLMGKGIGAHDGLAGLDGNTGDVAQELAGAVDLLRVDAGLRLIEGSSGLQRHGDLFQTCVARPLADAVDGALHLGGAGPDALQRVGNGHTQIVVAVDGDVHILDAVHILPQVADQIVHLLGGGVAHGVGDIQCGGAGGNGPLIAPGQELPIGAGGVLGRELNIVAVVLGIGHHFADALEDLLAAHLQLIFHVDVAGGQEHMDAGVLCALHRVPGNVDIALGTAGKACHHRLFHRSGDGLHAFMIHGGGNGKARLNDIHTQLFQLFGHFDLFREVHAAAGGLLAVSEGRVKNLDALHMRILLYVRSLLFFFMQGAEYSATKKASVSFTNEETKAKTSAVPLYLTVPVRFPHRPPWGECCLFGNGEETRFRLTAIGGSAKLLQGQ